MAADKNITIKFFAKGDDKLIEAFKNLATAQGKFNKTSDSVRNTSKKLNKSLVDMTFTLKQQGKSWKELGISSATLKKAFNGNRVAINKMNVAMKKTRKGSRLLDNTFATLRSKMLLFSFAMSLGGRQLAKFAQEAAKVQEMERAFTNLSGGAEKASIAVDKLGAATNGTMSKFDLFQQANNALILGVSKNSDEMARMFDVAQRLGAALGKDTKHSVESLITGIGRQSRLMLDNIGIIVKADEAYENYAAGLGISADKLSDSEKKQAFLNATMEAAEEKLLRVGEEVLSYNAKLQIASARMADAGVAIGNVLLPALASLALFFTDTDNIRRFTTALLGLGAGIAFVNKKAIQARISVIAMNMSFKMSRKALIASGWGVAVLILGELASWLLTTKEANDGLTGSWKRQSVAMSPILLSYQKLIDQKKRLIQATKDEMAALDFPSPVLFHIDEEMEARKRRFAGIRTQNEERKQIAADAAALEQEHHMKRMTDAKEYIASQKEIGKVLMAQQPIISELSSIDMDASDKKRAALNEIGEMVARGFADNADMATMYADAVKEIDARVLEDKVAHYTEQISMATSAFSNMTSAMSTQINARMKNEMDSMKKGDDYKRASSKRKKEMEKDVTDGYAKERTRVANFEKAASIAEAGVNIATAITKALPNIPLAALIGVLGAAQMAAIVTTPIPKFARGGMVGGRRHSAGGTMIEAEQGEFIMSRNAVNAVGVEAMNRINAGGGGGSVNISFEGNVMSQDFIEDEAIPMIKEAIRRGADIGVA